MATVTIPVVKITDRRGKPVLVPEVDKDGKVIWEIENKVPKDKKGDTVDVIETLVQNIPRSIHMGRDPDYNALMFQVLLAHKEKPEAERNELTIPKPLYDWLWRVLLRKVPLTKDQREDDKDMVEVSYLHEGFQMDASAIGAQLTCKSEIPKTPPTMDQILKDLPNEG